MTEDEMNRWHHQLNGREFEQALGDGEGQGSLVCCSLWGCKELDRTERLNNHHHLFIKCLTYMVLKNYLFIFGCAGSSWLCASFLQLQRAGTALHCSTRVSHCCGFSCCRAQALEHSLRAWAQYLWHMGVVDPWHAGSSRTRDRTHVSCIGRQILNPWTTGKALAYILKQEGSVAEVPQSQTAPRANCSFSLPSGITFCKSLTRVWFSHP